MEGSCLLNQILGKLSSLVSNVISLCFFSLHGSLCVIWSFKCWLGGGGVVNADQFKAINDEGMPIYQRPFMRGKLYIQFNVEFPDTLSPEQCKALEAVLPARATTQLTDMELDECEETTLHDVNIEEEMRRKQAQAQEAYEEDEEMPGGAQRVQCAQQWWILIPEISFSQVLIQSANVLSTTNLDNCHYIHYGGWWNSHSSLWPLSSITSALAYHQPPATWIKRWHYIVLPSMIKMILWGLSRLLTLLFFSLCICSKNGNVGFDICHYGSWKQQQDASHDILWKKQKNKKKSQWKVSLNLLGPSLDAFH